MALYDNRFHAGKLLATKLGHLKNRSDVLILALPRGGVPVAFEISRYLNVPFDILLVRKLGVPGYEELAMGAIASGGAKVLNYDVISQLRIKDKDIANEIKREEAELTRRERVYRANRLPLDIENKWIVLVDDGLATGATMLAALQALRQKRPSKITVAVPVAPPSTCSQLQAEADEVICLHTPEPFDGVGRWYEDFSQTSDQQVQEILKEAQY